MERVLKYNQCFHSQTQMSKLIYLCHITNIPSPSNPSPHLITLSDKMQQNLPSRLSRLPHDCFLFNSHAKVDFLASNTLHTVHPSRFRSPSQPYTFYIQSINLFSAIVFIPTLHMLKLLQQFLLCSINNSLIIPALLRN